MSIFADNLARLREVQELENISEQDMELLLQPVQTLKTDLSIGKQVFSAWRIVYNRALGPGKGGIRFHIIYYNKHPGGVSRGLFNYFKNSQKLCLSFSSLMFLKPACCANLRNSLLVKAW